MSVSLAGTVLQNMMYKVPISTSATKDMRHDLCNGEGCWVELLCCLTRKGAPLPNCMHWIPLIDVTHQCGGLGHFNGAVCDVRG